METDETFPSHGDRYGYDEYNTTPYTTENTEYNTYSEKTIDKKSSKNKKPKKEKKKKKKKSKDSEEITDSKQVKVRRISVSSDIDETCLLA